MNELHANELKTLIDQGAPLQLVDVREPQEVAFASIGGVNIPLRELPVRAYELDPTLYTVTLCHHGVRSAQAAEFLSHFGISRVANLAGGIDAWSQLIDPKVARY